MTQIPETHCKQTWNKTKGNLNETENNPLHGFNYMLSLVFWNLSQESKDQITNEAASKATEFKAIQAKSAEASMAKDLEDLL